MDINWMHLARAVKEERAERVIILMDLVIFALVMVIASLIAKNTPNI